MESFDASLREHISYLVAPLKSPYAHNTHAHWSEFTCWLLSAAPSLYIAQVAVAHALEAVREQCHEWVLEHGHAFARAGKRMRRTVREYPWATVGGRSALLGAPVAHS